MPMIIVRVVKTVELQVTDRIVAKKNHLVFDSSFDEEIQLHHLDETLISLFFS